MKKVLFLITLLSAFIPAFAAIKPEFVVNDTLKKCAVWQPYVKYTLPEEWKVFGTDSIQNLSSSNQEFAAICSSLGYTYRQSIFYGTLKPVFLLTNTVFLATFLIGVFLLFKRFLSNQKRGYLKFIVGLVVLWFILTSMYPHVMYRIEPCASSFIPC